MTILQRLRNKRAQAMVETALILPFLTLLTLGAADLGRAFYLHLEITGAARAGMRNAIQSTDHTQVVPVHIGDERADLAALAQHQEMIEERAA